MRHLIPRGDAGDVTWTVGPDTWRSQSDAVEAPLQPEDPIEEGKKMKRTSIVMAMIVALALSAVSTALATTGAITAPGAGDIIVSNTLQLRAYETTATDGVSWAVRDATNNPDCVSHINGVLMTKAGNVDGFTDTSTWVAAETGKTFSKDLVVSAWDRGDYCFAFNPHPTNTTRYAVFFDLGTATSKDACKDGGWMTFGDYRNQGECVSSFAKASNR
jgi:hypothetical protein